MLVLLLLVSFRDKGTWLQVKNHNLEQKQTLIYPMSQIAYIYLYIYISIYLYIYIYVYIYHTAIVSTEF